MILLWKKSLIKRFLGADVEYVLEDGNLVTSVGLSENEESGCRIIICAVLSIFGSERSAVDRRISACA